MKTSLHKTCLCVVSKQGFTLIELLVVETIISFTLAVLVVGMHRARILAKRVACQHNLRQIWLGWDSYLSGNGDQFCQGLNVNHDFGGWKGTGGFALSRPLNPHLGLPLAVRTADGATVFRCPADGGQIHNKPSHVKAYSYYGNSYETNFMLIGPDQIRILDPSLTELIREINKRLPGLSRGAVSEPARLLMFGDNNWITQWYKSRPRGNDWHGRRDCYNLAFLDGHVEFVRIRKGAFLTSEYRVLPFAELNALAPWAP